MASSMEPTNHARRQEHLNRLAELYRMYAAELQRFIYSKVGDLALAEDLTSTVFLKALRWLREDQSLESARGWLYATARTTIVDDWQTQHQYEMRPLSDLEAQSLTSESAEFVNQQSEMRVQHLLSLLPERDRRILTLRYLQGYSAAEIAEALGTSAGHIRVLQLRALRRAAQLEAIERTHPTMQEQPTPFDSFARSLTPEPPPRARSLPPGNVHPFTLVYRHRTPVVGPGERRHPHLISYSPGYHARTHSCWHRFHLRPPATTRSGDPCPAT